jgi:hypothetical protein
MKRSEMVTLLEDILNKYTTNNGIEITADELLGEIEWAGMEPPEIGYWNSPKPRDLNEHSIPRILNADIYIMASI